MIAWAISVAGSIVCQVLTFIELGRPYFEALHLDLCTSLQALTNAKLSQQRF